MTFLIEPRRYDDPEVVQLVAQVQAEYVARYGGPDGAVVGTDEFVPPAGVFLVGLLDGEAVAMGGWRRLAADSAEIKRMYVAPGVRRRGYSRAMLAELERTAREAGIAELVLNTGPAQPEAVALYESAGYRVVPGFGYYQRFPDALFYGKNLAGDHISAGQSGG